MNKVFVYYKAAYKLKTSIISKRFRFKAST